MRSCGLAFGEQAVRGAWWADAADEFALFDERDDHVDATVWLAAAANETEAAPTATLPAAPKAHLALML